MKKLLKFDIMHPSEFLLKKQKEWADLDELSLKEYRERLISLRSNYSDYYTHHLNETGEWEAEEFFLHDDVFLQKVAKELYPPKSQKQKITKKIKDYVLKKPPLDKKAQDHKIIHDYIKRFKPDVIFARSQPLPSKFWKKFRKKALIVARLSARMPHNWHPEDFDIIYTDQPDFKTFFDLHGVKTIINDQGFDQRVYNEIQKREKKHNLTFIGGLGTQNFKKRTEFINEIAKKVDFKWWGYWWNFGSDGRTFEDFEALKKTFQGPTSGLEMYQHCSDSRICLNDYVDTSNGIGFNQRMFEIMGVGGFMLTREAPNFEKDFPKGIFATYKNIDDCLDKIQYYLKADKEREEIAAAGHKFISENYDYSRIALEFATDLKKMMAEKDL
ncbi:MAG: glycosyltransferase [Nonlabens sp.]